jgi:hypothetical protein
MNQNAKHYMNSLLFIPIVTNLTAIDGNIYTTATFWFIIATWFYLKIEKDMATRKSRLFFLDSFCDS